MCAARRATAMSLSTTRHCDINNKKRKQEATTKQKQTEGMAGSEECNPDLCLCLCQCLSMSVNVCLIHESSHVNRQKHIKTKEQITCAQLRLLQSSSKRGLSSGADKPESTRQFCETSKGAEIALRRPRELGAEACFAWDNTAQR